MEFTPSSTDTVGVEIELQLLDAGTLDLTDGILPLLERLPRASCIKPEAIQNTVEVVSKVCTDFDVLETQLRSAVSELQAQCGSLGMRLCGAGTHPFSSRLTRIMPLPRYQRMEAQAGFRLRGQSTFATHVHLGMASGDEAVALMHALKSCLPLLIALSANSPFWQGHDTGCVSYRHRLLATTRSYGVPPSFSDWAQFVAFYDAARNAELFASVSDIHWDLRPRPHFGTLEVRVMDQQSTVTEAVALAAFVHVLAQFLRRVGNRLPPGLPPALPWWMEKENHFQATRLGVAAPCIVRADGLVRPLADVCQDAFAALQPLAEELGLASRLRQLRWRIACGLGYQRQRRTFSESGSLQAVVEKLVAELASETAVPPAVAAGL